MKRPVLIRPCGNACGLLQAVLSLITLRLHQHSFFWDEASSPRCRKIDAHSRSRLLQAVAGGLSYDVRLYVVGARRPPGRRALLSGCNAVISILR